MTHLILKMCNASDPPVSCRLVFKQPDRHVFTAGEKVEGTLIVSHQKDLILHGFKVVLEGTAFTKYKEGETIQNKTDTFLSTHQYVFGKDTNLSTGQKFRLAGGPTPKKYQFSIKFPDENLPASFKSPFGMVHYQIVTYMHMPNERFVKKAEKVVIVSSYLVLKDAVLNPFICEKAEKCISVRRSGRQFKFKMSLPQTGYLPGEEIPFEFELDNPNEYEIGNISVSLVQKTTYRAGNWSRILKTTSTELVSIEKTVMDTNFGTIWADAVKIPQKQVTTQLKGIIEIQYVLKVEVNPKNGVAGLRREIPIVIGTTRETGHERTRRSGDPESCQEPNSRPIPTSSGRQVREFQMEEYDDLYSPAGMVSNLERPPSYSTLSLRSMNRTASWETLPPDYEDVSGESGFVDLEQFEPLVPFTPDAQSPEELGSPEKDFKRLSISKD